MEHKGQGPKHPILSAPPPGGGQSPIPFSAPPTALVVEMNSPCLAEPGRGAESARVEPPQAPQSHTTKGPAQRPRITTQRPPCTDEKGAASKPRGARTMTKMFSRFCLLEHSLCSGEPASSPFRLSSSHTIIICVQGPMPRCFAMVVCSGCPRPGTPSSFFSGSPRTKTRAGPAGQHQVLLTCRLDRSSSYVSRSLSRPVSRPVCEGTQLGSTPKQGRCAVLACHRSKQDPFARRWLSARRQKGLCKI